MSRNIVVAGAGQAAIAFAAKLRSLDADCSITLIGDEPSLPYQRPPLSKKYLIGELERDRLLLRPSEWFAEAGIACRTRRSVAALDPAAKCVKLDDGEVLAYDKLLLATGTAPRLLPASIGGDSDRVVTLRTVADTDALAARLVPGGRLLIVGGGYIGLEVAASAVTLGMQVRVVEMAERILQRVASPATSDIFRAIHTDRGVQIMEFATIERLEELPDGGIRAHLGDGSTLQCDLVLVAIGIAPNDALAREAGLAVDNGIVVDAATRTSHPDIHAAGDCASFIYKGARTRLESVQNAIDQAEIAARVIAGEDAAYDPVPWFWSDQYDWHLQIAGLNRGYDRTVSRPGAHEGGQSVWYFAGDRFIAVDAVNDPRAYMSGKRILELDRAITPEQAGDPDFELKSLLKSARPDR